MRKSMPKMMASATGTTRPRRPLARGLEDLEDAVGRQSVAGEAGAVWDHFEQRQSEHALHAQVSAAGHVADDAPDLVGRLFEQREVVAEELDDDVGARARQQLI